MIPEPLVANIIDSARIEEVVGDFVTLKRRGANLIGLCPFHNERTPSFSVSPSKGIYKCFGCGAAGSSVKFVMEHEKMSYPEALRYLAKKYHITIEEVTDEEGKHEQQMLESLYVVTNFARQHFTHNLLHTDEGQSVGLSYFKQRGFSADTIAHFQLGYSLDSYTAFIAEAQKGQYSLELLQKTGLINRKSERDLPFFRSRVIFPIHNLSGKVVAFAGRTLSKDKNQPKYINSPETDIYVKSKILYGIYFAKKEIRQKDECILVEGYTDVISLHQAGIENVVASSGTSLTQEQIRLINRYTPNITILYDGDAAGLKAALRGVDLVLEEGLNVKVVVLPPGEDPDSYVQQYGKQTLLDYLHREAKDFVFFKTHLLLKEAGNDPIKRTALVKDIIQTIARIPDPIKRLMYVKECSQLLEVPENLIVNEANRLKWKKFNKEESAGAQNEEQMPDAMKAKDPKASKNKQAEKNLPDETVCEREIIRLLLEFGSEEIPLEHPDEQQTQPVYHTVAFCVVQEMASLPLKNPIYLRMFNLFKERIEQDSPPPTSEVFIMHPDETISRTAINLLTSPYELSENWEKKHGIFITDALIRFKEQVFDIINSYKLSHIMKMLDQTTEELKAASSEQQVNDLLQRHIRLTQLKGELSKLLGITIIR